MLPQAELEGQESLPLDCGFFIMAGNDPLLHQQENLLEKTIFGGTKRMKKKTRKSKKSSPRPIGRFLLWTAVFLLLVAAADQMLTRLQVSPPLLSDLQSCYREFRCRLFEPSCREKFKTIEAVIQTGAAPVVEPTRSYFYVDSQGALQFVDRLQDVPSAYRREAQPLLE